MSSEAGISYTTQVLTEPTVQIIDSFIKRYEVPRQSKFSNIVNQSGCPYYIPTYLISDPEQELGFDAPSHTRPIDQFFHLYDDCFRRGIVLNFCEQQFHYEPVRIIQTKRSEIDRIVDQTQPVQPAQLTPAPRTPISHLKARSTFADDDQPSRKPKPAVRSDSNSNTVKNSSTNESKATTPKAGNSSTKNSSAGTPKAGTPKANANYKPDLDDVSFSDEEGESTISADLNVDQGYRTVPLTREELQQVYTPDQLKAFAATQTTHTGIWFDFDILQRETSRKLGDAQYSLLIQGIVRIMRNTLELWSCPNPSGVLDRNKHNNGIICKLHAIVLRKRDVRAVNHKKYGTCYKESFHIRIPTVQVTRGYKVFLRKEVLKSGFLTQALSCLTLVNSLEEIVDNGVTYNAPMLLGSCKSGGREAHQIYKLYMVNVHSNDDSIMPQECDSFAPIEVPEGTGTPMTIKPRSRKAAAVPTVPRYNWNLPYEISLLYESPNPLIRKRRFDPKRELLLDIASLAEREAPGITASADLDTVDQAVKDLIQRNPDASFLKGCLDILSQERASNYHSWMSVILILARENPDYKPLGIRFSQRCPEKWANNGASSFEKIWNWGLNHPNERYEEQENSEETLRRRNVRTIYNWAAIDNPEAYKDLRSCSAFHEFFIKANEFQGRLNETHVADILEKLFGSKFVTDKVIIGTRASRVWYSFCYPDRHRQSHRTMYKWKHEADEPDTFDYCLSRIFPEYINRIITHFKRLEQRPENDEKHLKHYQETIKNLEALRYNLGNQATIKKYIVRAARIFQRDDFIDSLDTAENVIGTMNGVLILTPRTELLQCYNDYALTRSVTVDYVHIPREIRNGYRMAIQMAIEEIFAGQWDALEFNMIYLASALDDRRKVPMFVIWLGGGANGKSFLVEMMIKTLGDVTRGGYGYKLNANFFTAPGRSGGGPDTQKMQLEHARFTYASETNQMDKLHTSVIKEITSDTVSGNEKYGTQKNFDVNTRFILATNHPTRVEGNDHGIWRRLFCYWFKVTFKENPDPKNRFERKMNPEIIEVWPKDRNYKQAFLSYLMEWYETYRDKYRGNVLNVPRPTIDRETREFREKSDLMARFLREILEFVGNTYEDEVEDESGERVKKLVETKPISLVEIIGRYMDWHKANIDPKDVPAAMVISSQLVKYPEIERFLIEMGSGTTVQLLTQHIMHEVGERWQPKRRVSGKKHGRDTEPTESEGNLPLTLHRPGEVVVPELVLQAQRQEQHQERQEQAERIRLVDLENQDLKGQDLKGQDANDVDAKSQNKNADPSVGGTVTESTSRPDNIVGLGTAPGDVEIPEAHDDELNDADGMALKCLYPEFNRREMNEILLSRLDPKDKREMLARMGGKLSQADQIVVDLDPLAALDDMTERHVENLEPSITEDLEVLLPETTGTDDIEDPTNDELAEEITVASQRRSAKPKAAAKPKAGIAGLPRPTRLNTPIIKPKAAGVKKPRAPSRK